MRFPHSSLTLCVSTALVCISLVPCAAEPRPAQQPPSAQPKIALPPDAGTALDSICSKLAAEIQRRHFSSVAVFGASGPTQDFTELGAAIGDTVSEHLASAATGFAVVGRDELRAKLQADRISDLMALRTFSAQWLIREFNIPAATAVTLANPTESSVVLRVYLFDSNLHHLKSLAGWEFPLQLSPELRESLNRSLLTPEIAAAPPKDLKIGQQSPDDRSEPLCVLCRQPDYTPEARDAHWSGESHVSALISSNGKATEILLLDGAPYFLDRAEINIVKTWKFKPALNANQVPIAKRVQIIFTFQTD